MLNKNCLEEVELNAAKIYQRLYTANKISFDASLLL